MYPCNILQRRITKKREKCGIQAGKEIHCFQMFLCTFLFIPDLRVVVNGTEEVEENTDVTLLCIGTGTAPVKIYSWAFQHSSKMTVTSLIQENILKLPKVNYTQAGKYTCSASNNDFNITASFQLVVRCK